MNKTTLHKINDAMLNAQSYIEQMQQMDDNKLSKHLDLFMQQMERAYQQNNKEAYELLYQYEKQVITARLSKCK